MTGTLISVYRAMQPDQTDYIEVKCPVCGEVHRSDAKRLEVFGQAPPNL